jgi:hypothetical protein
VSKSLHNEVADALAEHGRLTSTSLALAVGRPWKKIAHVVDELANRGVIRTTEGGGYQLTTVDDRPLLDAETRPEKPARNTSAAASSRRASNPSGAPPASALSELVQLGTFLDSRTTGGVYSVNPRPLLLWSPKAKALIVLVGYKLPRPTSTSELPDIAARVFQTWTRGRRATKLREFEAKIGTAWTLAGDAKTIGYRSDKFHARGTTKDYQHEFGPGVKLYTLGGQMKGALAWRGGKLRITEDGIEG